MTYDPNWFYSSLAQCAAAIVGLIGALLAAKLQQQITDIRASQAKIHGSLNAIVTDAARLQREMEDFISFVNKRTRDISEARTAGRNTIRVTDDMQLFVRSGSISAQELPLDDRMFADYPRQKDLAERLLPVVRKISSAQTANEATKSTKLLDAIIPDFPEPSNGQPKALRQSLSQLENQAQVHAASIDLRFPAFMASILAFLCIVGLVAPLAFLTSFPGGSKELLLLLSSIGFLAIPAFLFTEIRRLHQAKRV